MKSINSPVMELTPAKFLALFLFLSVTGWLLFTFAARLAAWMLSRMIGAEVRFRFGGLNCLKDISFSFKKGALESLVIGEVRLRTCRPSLDAHGNEQGTTAMLQVLLCDAELILRKPAKQTPAKKRRPKRHLSGRGKWMILANITKYVTVSVVELVMQVPDWTLEVKELDLGMESEESGLSLLGARLVLTACSIYDREQTAYPEHTLSFGERLLSVGGLGNSIEGATAPCYIEQLSISSTFGHAREQGVTIRHIDVMFGDILLDINEELLGKLKLSGSRKDTKASGSSLHLREVGDQQATQFANEGHFLANAPEKASLNLSKLLLKCSHKERKPPLENAIIGVQVVCTKVQQMDDFGGSLSHFDVHLDSEEIHLLRDGDNSFVEIMKTAVIASMEIPKQTDILPQAEIDVKLGGAQCSFMMSKFEKWLDMLYSLRPRTQESELASTRKARNSKKRFNWACTVSAPDMAVSLHDTEGIILFNVSLQTSHVFVNSALKQGIGIHTELGELCIYMVEEKCMLYKGLFGMDTNSGCLLQMARVTVDFGVIDGETTTLSNTNGKKAVLVAEFTGTAIHLTQLRLQSLLSSIIGLMHHSRQMLAKHRTPRLSKSSAIQTAKKRKIQELKLNIEGISVQYCAQMHVVDTSVPDPKKVNFGCDGGEVVMEENNDGELRTASIKTATFRGFEGSNLVCKSILDTARLQLQVDYSQNDIQINLQRFKVKYQELKPDTKPFCEILVGALQNAKIIYRLGVVGNGVPGCYIRISDLKGRWEPDVHLFVMEAFLRLKVYSQKQKHLFSPAKGMRRSTISLSLDAPDDAEGSSNTKSVGKAVAVAVDVEHIDLSAALADGIEARLSIASMFSEDFKVGVLLEELKIMLNGAVVLKSKRLQLARIPCFMENKPEKTASQECLKCKTEISSCWDYLIQGSGVCIILPYRLECRAIDDAVEDTWRGLKIVMLAQRILIAGSASPPLARRKATGLSSSVGGVKFVFENITAEMEEEPLQGWFDEHHQLLLKQKLELDVRERLLDESILEGGMEADVSELKLKLQQQAFQSYRASCNNLKPYESSGSSRSTFQGGFRPSVNRGSLFSIKASNLEVALLDIEGGRSGMIEQIRKLDCVPADSEIPYSRVLGKRVRIATSSLVVHLRNYSLPMLSAIGGKCNGQLMFARQATCFPRQVLQGLYVGRWRKLTMFRSESGTTPPFKMFSELPIEFEKAEVAFGVGFEPALADVSYAFTVALRRADLSVHDLIENAHDGTDFFGVRLYGKPSSLSSQGVKKERNLPWWDDMRYYVHGQNSILSTDFKLFLLATTDPYEDSDFMKIEAGSMDIQQQEGILSFIARDFRLGTSSVECLMACQASKSFPTNQNQGSIQSPFFKLDITMDWDCETGNPLFHYLHAFPHELVTREKVYDPFRSTSLILRWNFRLADATTMETSAGLPGDTGCTSHKFRRHNIHRLSTYKPKASSASFSHAKAERFFDIPTMRLGGHDLMWIFRWWSTLYSPPHKLRTFSKWPRFAVTRSLRSGNLSLDKVLTDFMLRVDSTPARIKHISLIQDDPAEGLTFGMKRFKYELCYSRGKQRYTFDCKRDILELVYQGLDLHLLKADLRSEARFLCGTKCESSATRSADDPPQATSLTKDSTENGFFFSTDYFSLRKQAPKADLSRLSLWQEEARRPSNTKAMEFTHGSGSDPTRSDHSDDDGDSIVMPDNCLHVSLFGLKLLWAIYTRDAVWAWVENLYRAFETPKPSPSRQYAQRKIIEEHNKLAESYAVIQEGSPLQFNKVASCSPSPSRKDTRQFHPSPLAKTTKEPEEQDEAEEGTKHFMVNVVQPQFNLQSEEARGRFLLAAASGKVMARSFRSIINVGPEMIAQALRSGGDHLSGNIPEVTWSRRELSVLLEQVQAHVAPTDVDPGAGLQWLPRIPSGSQKVKRTGALLERVFLPCAMYFQYTRCKSEASDVKVKALKELSFNSSNITAIMTSRQFQVMVDIISNLLLARLPKPRRYFSLHGGDEEEDAEEETDEVVPDGVPEVELARIKLEEAERALKLLSADLKAVNQGFSAFKDEHDEEMKERGPWMMHCEKQTLASRLSEDWSIKLKARKLAARSLRIALQRAAQQRFKEKEKTKSIPSAMRISWAIDKIVWSMLFDGQTFAEAEISNMNLNVDRDFHEVGIAQFTAKHFVVKNCLPLAKSNTVLSAWNPPSEWGRNSMLRVDARQGAPKEGNSPLELFQVEIYPLRIHLTEKMYRMMWDYFFPKEDRDTQRRQVWEASTTAVVKRGKKMTSGGNEGPSSSTTKRDQMPTKGSGTLSSILPSGIQPQLKGEEWQGVDFKLTAQILEKDMKMANARGTKLSGLQRSSSFDASKEDNPDDASVLEMVQNTDSTFALSLSRNLHCGQPEQVETVQQNSLISISPVDNGLLKSRDTPRGNRSHKLSRDDKKLVKSSSQDEKKSSAHNPTNLELHNIKISQVELLVTYEGSRLSVNELRLLMDTFTRVQFRGTWRRFFSRVKKHIIWSVLKSVAGMQGKKFKDKLQSQGQVDAGGYPGDESSSSDSDGSNAGAYEQFFPSNFKRSTDRAGEGEAIMKSLRVAGQRVKLTVHLSPDN
ncbi:hypothetical protein GOP47_0012806 [Adiantum capillus-veneris]|uniref:FMP27/BLTP2/Hobbit GFWDK motif-containing RBG unit domain-containing protein n=1 Tax=Adiantum capillus-veneris TaxID=13818 RepID=A0A9D4ZGU6_ADICA|nr:hypothetical protein GOP47_0012806 [Adiantum capillus-veneris]